MSKYYTVAESADKLIAEARQLTGIEIVDEEALATLPIIVDSFNKEAEFHAAGAKEMRKFLVRYLVNRLYMKRDFELHPEIRDIELKPPVIITCIPRTGSTKLQKVLAATGDFNFTPLWKGMNFGSVTGIPNEPLDTRISDAMDFATYFNEHSPAARKIHSLEALEPEEDTFIMGCSLVSPQIGAFANCPSYLAWYSRQDRQLQYQFDKDVLKYLTWQGLADPEKPFVLKSPFNSGMENQYLKVFPDAHLILPHRHPRESVASFCRLRRAYESAFSDSVFDLSMMPGVHARSKKREMKFRSEHPEQRFHDIAYSQLTRDVEGVLREVYKFIGMELRQEVLRQIQEWSDVNPINKHGKNVYTPDEFGFTEQSIDEDFAEYIEQYAAYF